MGVSRVHLLSGVRVLDLTRLLPGPYATRLLVDMGAGVVKVEDPAGDPLRQLQPHWFQWLNRGKQSVRLDLKQAAARAAFLRLCRSADAVLEGFRPGVMDRLGLGYAALAEQNPRLVLVSLCGYSPDGPERDRAGHDLNYLAAVGLLGLMPPGVDGAPANPPPPVCRTWRRGSLTRTRAPWPGRWRRCSARGPWRPGRHWPGRRRLPACIRSCGRSRWRRCPPPGRRRPRRAPTPGKYCGKPAWRTPNWTPWPLRARSDYELREGIAVANNKLQEIIAASIQLFKEKGYHATSMQDIADAVGLQKGSLYHYISSKEELLIIIIQEALEVYVGRLNEIAAGDVPPRVKFAAALRFHLIGIATNLGMLTIFLREAHALTPEQREIVQRETERYNSVIEGIYAEGVRDGVFRPLDPKLACRTVLGACNWFYRWYRPDGRLSLEEMAEFFVDILFNGIVATDQRA